MFFNWDDIQKALVPVKSYQDLCQRLQESFTYPFVRKIFNFTVPELIHYTEIGVGGDPRGRYTEYASHLIGILTALSQAGIDNVLSLITSVGTGEYLRDFTERHSIYAHDIVVVQKYLLYWVIPTEKYLSGLVRDNPSANQAIKVLGEIGIRTNLQILQLGLTSDSRKSLSDTSGIPEPVLTEVINIADFSRLPWASKATISNIMGAGYSSLAQLANADPVQLYSDFFSYGKAIGKNLKLGNEIENSYRLAKIIPVVIQPG